MNGYRADMIIYDDIVEYYWLETSAKDYAINAYMNWALTKAREKVIMNYECNQALYSIPPIHKTAGTASTCFDILAKSASTKQAMPSMPCVQKKENNMSNITVNTVSESTPDERKTNVVLSALSTSYYEKKSELDIFYGIEDDERPRTMRELLARIAAGKFIVEDRNMDERFWGPRDLMDVVRWRDPAKKEDYTGLKKATIALEKAWKDCITDITVLGSEKGLQILRDFQAKTFN